MWQVPEGRSVHRAAKATFNEITSRFSVTWLVVTECIWIGMPRSVLTGQGLAVGRACCAGDGEHGGSTCGFC